MSKFTLLVLPFLVAAPVAEACTPLNKPSYVVHTFTNYSPIDKGMNGHCGTSSTKGWDACAFFLEDYLNGQTNAVMAAVPQRGGSSELFGGLYRGVSLENSIARATGKVVPCVQVAAADHYAKASNDMSKMDIVTKDKRSKLTQAVNATRDGTMIPLGRLKDLKEPGRLVARNPEALTEEPHFVSSPRIQEPLAYSTRRPADATPVESAAASYTGTSAAGASASATAASGIVLPTGSKAPIPKKAPARVPASNTVPVPIPRPVTNPAVYIDPFGSPQVGVGFDGNKE